MADGSRANRGQPLQLPADVRWSCLQCGRSCEDWTEVEISGEEAKRLRRLPLFDPTLSDGGDSLPYVAGTRELEQLLLRFEATAEGAHCVLMNRAKLCAVHVAHGEAAKPSTCRAFPFFFVDTPGGEFAAVSFACTAVLVDHGERVIDQADDVLTIRTFATHRERRGHNLLLAPGTPMAWRDYVPLEKQLCEILGTTASVADALIRQGDVIRRSAGLATSRRDASPALTTALLGLLSDVSGRPPRFETDVAELRQSPPDLLHRWVTHRLWRKDLLRGGEVLFAHALLAAEVALACTWTERCGGLAAAIAHVERGLSLHSDLVRRLEEDRGLRQRARRLLHAPRSVASAVVPIRAQQAITEPTAIWT